MALYVTDIKDYNRQTFINDYFKPFLEGIGWTIDLYVNNSRIHFSNPNTDQHYEITWSSTYNITITGCTGFDSGAAYNAQPGHYGTFTSSSFVWGSSGRAGGLYCSGDNIHWTGRAGASQYPITFSLFNATRKIGGWAGGPGFALAGSGCAFSIDGVGRTGAWTHGNTPLNQRPLVWTRSSYLVPVMLFANDWVESSSFKIPIGYIDGLYSCSPGDDWKENEIVTINGEQYIWALPYDSWGLIHLKALS